MSVISAIADGGALAVSEHPEDLTAIKRPEMAAAIWQRKPLRCFESWLDALAPEQLPKARLILAPNAVHAAVAQQCDIAGMPEGPERTRLVDDIAAQADLFAGLMDTPYLRLRLDVVSGNACRKFHIDALTARLICTYRGTGTQYGYAARGQEPECIFTLPRGASMILRGTLWPTEPDAGLLHRSPPIEGTGETRLVLVLDPIKDLEAA